MSGLNPGQLDAVNTLSGPMLVLAGAGSGKTRVITFRIAKLIKSGVAAERILGVTFTNKAATEMQQRLGDLIGTNREKKPHISTFHSLCVRVLRENIDKLGYPKKFAIYNRGDQESLARGVLREINVADNMLKPSQLLYHISSWKSRSVAPSAAVFDADTDKAHLAAIAFEKYQTALKNRGCVDFDDLLLLTEQLFREHEDCRKIHAARFDHILVDEYQDTNGSQYRIIRALAHEHQNLCVVGDDDQSIYGWRGAEVEHILRFRDDWPAAKEIRLQDNYRSTAAILAYANRLIKFNKTRHDKVLIAARANGAPPQILQYPNEAQEAAETVRSIQSRLTEPGREPRDFAILFRTNEQPRPFETELRKAKLPYVLVGGMSFFDRKEVKDILSYLRLIAGHDDEVSILRIINTPPRGIGKKSNATLLDFAVKNGHDLWKIVTGEIARPKLPTNSLRGLDRLAHVVETARNNSDKSLVEQARDLIKAIDYRGEIDRVYDDPNDREARWNTVEQIVNAIGEYETSKKKTSMLDFIDKLTVGDQDPADEKEKQLKRNSIVLMTMHSAKGLEFPEVYIVGLEEGILPHHRSLDGDEAGVEEERRLCYVGVTRAEDRLTMSMSLTRMKWGKPRDTIPSRFLYELTGQAEHPNYVQRRHRPHSSGPNKKPGSESHKGESHKG